MKTFSTKIRFWPNDQIFYLLKYPTFQCDSAKDSFFCFFDYQFYLFKPSHLLFIFLILDISTIFFASTLTYFNKDYIDTSISNAANNLKNTLSIRIEMVLQFKTPAT